MQDRIDVKMAARDTFALILFIVAPLIALSKSIGIFMGASTGWIFFLGTIAIIVKYIVDFDGRNR